MAAKRRDNPDLQYIPVNTRMTDGMYDRLTEYCEENRVSIAQALRDGIDLLIETKR